MASTWANGVARVTVPKSTTPKHVTIVLPFYMNHKFLADHLWEWRGYDEAIRSHLRAVIVDDGSPTPLDVRTLCPMPFQIRAFRIEQDVPWNWLAARNIGAKYAETDWLLLTDIDHIVNADTAEAVVMGQHDPNVVYAFSRREHTGESIAPHSASFLMTRAMFWKIGGYDERLSGVYGTDGIYRKRVAATAPMRVLTDELIRFEFVSDASVTTLERKTPAMAEARAQRLASLPQGPPLVMSFPHHEVAP